MKRAIIIVLILTAVISGSVGSYLYLTPTEPKTVADDPNIEIVEAKLDSLVDTVSATGQIEPRAEVEMKFETGGVVDDVPVKRGQLVAQGAVLARLRTDNLEYDIRQAEIDLAQQEANLQKLFEPTLTEKIAEAQAKVTSARLKLADLLDGPDPDDVAKAEAELSLKKVELKKAQWDYDQVAYRGDVGAMPQADALQEATLNFEIATANYNLAVKDPTPADIAEARANIASAEAVLADLLAGPAAADVASQQAGVDKARLSLQQKRADLRDAVLTAPTQGVVLEVSIEPGERVFNEADAPAMVIADTTAYLLKVQVDEIDISRIQIGQPVAVTLDAFPDEELKGEVTDISPSPNKNDSSGIVTFEVVITLRGENLALLPGMTATAAIETDRMEDAVVVANRAIQIERGEDKSTVFVEKLDETGNPVRVEVELGLRYGDVTQVKSGLAAGDRVVIRTEPGLPGSPNL